MTRPDNKICNPNPNSNHDNIIGSLLTGLSRPDIPLMITASNQFKSTYFWAMSSFGCNCK